MDGISGGGAVAKYKKPTQSAESAKTIDDQEPTLGELEKKLANLRTESARRKELGSLKDRVEKLNDSDKLNDEDWVDYQALVRYYGLKTGNRPKAFTALTRLIKLTKNFDAMEDNKTFMENDDIQDEEIEALRQRYIKNTSDDSPLNVRTVKPMKRIAQKDEAGQVITNSPTKLRLAVKNTITQKDYPVTENRI